MLWDWPQRLRAAIDAAHANALREYGEAIGAQIQQAEQDAARIRVLALAAELPPEPGRHYLPDLGGPVTPPPPAPAVPTVPIPGPATPPGPAQ